MAEEERKDVPENREEEKPEEAPRTEEKKAQPDEEEEPQDNESEEQPEPSDDKAARPRKKHLEMGKTKFSISIVIIAAVFFAAGFLMNTPAAIGSCAVGDVMTGALTAQEASEIAVDYINDNLLQAGVMAELINYTESNGVYAFEMEFTSGEDSMVYTSYVTKDGELLFTNTVDMTESIDAAGGASETPDTGTPKSEKPEVDIFIMSYCPYGLQMQKAALPAMELLKDKADINIRFVYYIMHDKVEVDENTVQYCIQKDQEDRLVDYLECFTLTGDSETCRATAGVDEDTLASCIAAADSEFSITANYEDTESWLSGMFPLYDVDKELNEMYGVGGSPTVVINGQQATVDRSPEGFKQAVCAAFSTPPEECSTALSTEAASPGIGGGTASASSDAGCGA